MFRKNVKIKYLLLKNKIQYLKVKRVPMSSMDKSSAFEVGKVNLYL